MKYQIKCTAKTTFPIASLNAMYAMLYQTARRVGSQNPTTLVHNNTVSASSLSSALPNYINYIIISTPAISTATKQHISDCDYNLRVHIKMSTTKELQGDQNGKFYVVYTSKKEFETPTKKSEAYCLWNTPQRSASQEDVNQQGPSKPSWNNTYRASSANWGPSTSHKNNQDPNAGQFSSFYTFGASSNPSNNGCGASNYVNNGCGASNNSTMNYSYNGCGNSNYNITNNSITWNDGTQNKKEEDPTKRWCI